jgi:hypothetical protein
VDYSSKKVESARRRAFAQEARVARQRQMIDAALIARHPLDDLQARLLVMEQSLLAMKRFLKILERDLEVSLGVNRATRPKRLRATKRPADPSHPSQRQPPPEP